MQHPTYICKQTHHTYAHEDHTHLSEWREPGLETYTHTNTSPHSQLSEQRHPGPEYVHTHPHRPDWVAQARSGRCIHTCTQTHHTTHLSLSSTSQVWKMYTHIHTHAHKHITPHTSDWAAQARSGRCIYTNTHSHKHITPHTSDWAAQARSGRCIYTNTHSHKHTWLSGESLVWNYQQRRQPQMAGNCQTKSRPHPLASLQQKHAHMKQDDSCYQLYVPTSVQIDCQQAVSPCLCIKTKPFLKNLKVLNSTLFLASQWLQLVTKAPETMQNNSKAEECT